MNIDGNCIQRLGTLLGSTATASSATTTSSLTIAPTQSVLSSESHPSTPAGALVGIGLGSALVAVSLTLLSIYLLRRRRRQNVSVLLPAGMSHTLSAAVPHLDSEHFEKAYCLPQHLNSRTGIPGYWRLRLFVATAVAMSVSSIVYHLRKKLI